MQSLGLVLVLLASKILFAHLQNPTRTTLYHNEFVSGFPAA